MSGPQNPWQSPQTTSQPAQQFAGEYQPCPQCRSGGASKVGWTLWGGVIGPKILSHVKCPQCGTKYNGKTGQSNTTAIVIYTVVCIALGLGVAVAFAVFGFFS